MLKKYWRFFKKGIHYLRVHHGIPDSLLDGEGSFVIHVEQMYGMAIDDRKVPFNRQDYLEHRDGPIRLNWVIPEMGQGSGGHINIFRFISALERRGIKNRIYVVHPVNFATDKALRAFLSENYPILDPEIEVHCSTDNMPFCHGIVATSWPTAYFVRHFDNAVSKFYFVQDFESYFYPIGSEYMLASNTYRFGFRGITAGDWLKHKLETEYSMPCNSFRFSYDKQLYRPGKKRDDKQRIFFYARPVTPRRCFELGLLALIELTRRMPEVEVVLAGWDVSRYYIPFNHVSAGSVSLDKLSDMYAQCDICLVMSPTNLSLLPLEVMASNSVIATQGSENNAWMVDERNAIIIDNDPLNIADTLQHYLNHPEKLKALREAGLKCAVATDWDDETNKVYECIVEGIKEDEQKL